jgi:hypothetical protein
MSIQEIVQKFIEKNYLADMGASSIAKILNCSREDVCLARKIYRKQYNKNSELSEPEEFLPKGKLKSRWQSASGKWLESYQYDDTENETVDFGEVFKSVVLEHLDYYEPVRTINPVPSSDKTLNLYLSDQHIGASVSNGLYENQFNRTEFSSRMFAILSEVDDLSRTYGLFERINIVFLGDTFDGFDGFTVKRTHSLPQNMSNKECFETFLSVHMEFFDALISLGLTENYGVYMLSESNHGGDFDYMGFRAMECWLNQKYSFIETKIFNTFIGILRQGVHTFLLTHGKDQRDMKFGLPLFLNDKAELFINQFIDANRLSGEISLIKGDLHQSNSFYGKKFRYRNVGSNFGYTRPCANYDIFNKHSSNIIEGIIHLD